ISHGATRLQEVLADRMAALKYGAQAFQEGLTHVVRQSVEFNHLANRAIDESSSSQQALQNLYDLHTTDNERLDDQIKASLDRETTEDDTHPGPNDRFRFTSRITSQSEPSISGMVWDLFRDREAL